MELRCAFLDQAASFMLAPGKKGRSLEEQSARIAASVFIGILTVGLAHLALFLYEIAVLEKGRVKHFPAKEIICTKLLISGQSFKLKSKEETLRSLRYFIIEVSQTLKKNLNDGGKKEKFINELFPVPQPSEALLKLKEWIQRYEDEPEKVLKEAQNRFKKETSIEQLRNRFDYQQNIYANEVRTAAQTRAATLQLIESQAEWKPGVEEALMNFVKSASLGDCKITLDLFIKAIQQAANKKIENIQEHAQPTLRCLAIVLLNTDALNLLLDKMVFIDEQEVTDDQFWDEAQEFKGISNLLIKNLMSIPEQFDLNFTNLGG